jgi:hypothetical protein
MNTIILSLALLSMFALGSFAQDKGGGREVGGGRVPAGGPTLVKVGAIATAQGAAADKPGHPKAPHVHSDDVWIGHDSGPNDPRYHVDQPWQSGRYTGGIGKGPLSPLDGMAGDRFWFKGYYFSIAASDKDYANNWFWESDQIAIYQDRVHVGWYLAYNVRLGTYVHAMYRGLASAQLILPEAPAKKTFETVCSTCHELRASPPRSRAAWAAVVDSMAARGASATDQEFAAIVDYLARYFGVTNANQGDGQRDR